MIWRSTTTDAKKEKRVGDSRHQLALSWQDNCLYKCTDPLVRKLGVMPVVRFN